MSMTQPKALLIVDGSCETEQARAFLQRRGVSFVEATDTEAPAYHGQRAPTLIIAGTILQGVQQIKAGVNVPRRF